jgi:GNAT superfamily N-acetyltransferase
MVIRAYRDADRDAVFAIAASTAFFGEPVEAYMEDRSLFCDLLYRYYTVFERDLGLVVDDGETVTGFLLGCRDSRAVRARWLRTILPGVLGRLVRGQYDIGPRTRRFALATMRATLRHGRPHADLARYPAHLHMNLLPSTRGQGLGRRLLEAYLQQLGALGVPGVHLNTTDFNVAACHLYEKVGFALLDARPATAWKELIATPVENRCYGLRL